MRLSVLLGVGFFGFQVSGRLGLGFRVSGFEVFQAFLDPGRGFRVYDGFVV